MCFLAMIASAQTQNNTTIITPVAAVITTGIAITNTADLVFGDIVPATTTAGTVVIDPAGTRSATTVTLGNGRYGSASFDITRSGGGNPHFTIVMPSSVTISSGANSMTVDSFTSNYPTPPPQQTAPFTLTVGATLHVGASQPVGTYSGTFTVTAIQQ